ncbi:hypothetical protein Taro_020239 [Colocasia esculenta]|uniref:Uncharacterized protein n=1 Tax=Colocasia esculenta TaxID=4460 RepID=A0A843UN59_COLES|nr:hypothetical protein [Colocasia esculenta]
MELLKMVVQMNFKLCLDRTLNFREVLLCVYLSTGNLDLSTGTPVLKPVLRCLCLSVDTLLWGYDRHLPVVSLPLALLLLPLLGLVLLSAHAAEV